jgi:hypothetical protein
LSIDINAVASPNDPRGSSEVHFVGDVERPDFLSVRCTAAYDTPIKLVEASPGRRRTRTG